jgi:flagellar biosynthesis protein FliR
MISIEPILPHVPAFVVVLSRVGGLFVFTPVLSSSAVPMKFKTLLVLVLSAAIYPVANLDHLVGMRLDLLSLAPLVATEAMIGVTLGLLASIPMLSVQLAGLLMGQQMGLGLAQVINPAADVEGDSIGQMLFMIAIAAFVTMDGFEILFGALVQTFTLVPAGSFALADAPLGLLVGLITAGFEMALRIAMPVLAVIFVESIAVGFLMKTVPSLNIMSFGFPVRILIGLLSLLMAIALMGQLIVEEVGVALEIVQDWVWSFG